MRGKVTDQDLTNYALNELSPEERLYVESMLGVSEECRNDVYQMLDLSEMLKDGFEQREIAAELLLNEDQRSRVLTVARFHWRDFFQRAAAVALLAAGVGYGLSVNDLWQRGKESLFGIAAKAGEQNFPTTADQLTALMIKAGLPSEPSDLQMVQGPSICTPPVLGEISDMGPMPEQPGTM